MEFEFIEDVNVWDLIAYDDIEKQTLKKAEQGELVANVAKRNYYKWSVISIKELII